MPQQKTGGLDTEKAIPSIIPCPTAVALPGMYQYIGNRCRGCIPPQSRQKQDPEATPASVFGHDFKAYK
jgi:hypothetical protein